MRVGDLTPAPVVVSPGTHVPDAANILRGWNVGCAPVVERGRVVGLLTTADVCALVGRAPSEPSGSPPSSRAAGTRSAASARAPGKR